MISHLANYLLQPTLKIYNVLVYEQIMWNFYTELVPGYPLSGTSENH